MNRFHSIRALALATVFGVALAMPLAAAEHDAEEPTREDLLAAALAGDPEARSALTALFDELRGDSQAIAGLAVDLIDALAGDPVAITDAATLIADVATEALITQPIVNVSVDQDFKLPPGALGWDLGSPDSPTYPGFAKVSQKDGSIVGGSSTGVRRPGGEGLLSDGLLNIERFYVEVPDGVYRLILLTDALGNTTGVNPLGQAIMVNGVRTSIAGGAPDSWLGNGRLGGGAQTASAGPTGTQTGGATVIYVVVVDGRLLIEFLPQANQNIFLTGLILEPADGPSVLNLPEDVFNDDDEILFAESIIAEAIGQSLEKIVAAAGDEAEREKLLLLGEPLAAQQDAVSPN